MLRTILRSVVLLALAVPLLGVLWVTPTLAQVDPRVEPPDQIVLSGRVDVPRGRTVGQVVVFRGSVNVQGVALGDVVVVSGKLVVSGQVGGSVVNLDGPVVLAESAQVRGDVLSRQEVIVRRGAQVEGSVRSDVPFSLRGPVGWFGAFAAWLAVTISALVLGLLLLWLLPRASDGVAETAHEAWLPSAGWGLAWLIGFPILALLSMLTLVVLPLGLTFLLALGFLFSVGHAWAGWIVGRLVLPEKGPYVAFLAGLGIVRVVGLIPWVGGLVWILAGGFGLGAATVAAWRSRDAGGKHRHGRRRLEIPAPSREAASTASTAGSSRSGFDPEPPPQRAAP
ncbi:MAG: hypothetical protein WD206_07395 [Actinomycetota bacterium]